MSSAAELGVDSRKMTKGRMSLCELFSQVISLVIFDEESDSRSTFKAAMETVLVNMRRSIQADNNSELKFLQQ